MQMTWTWDAPSGVYKNNLLSAKVREVALAETKMMQFVNAEPGYGRGKGESITIVRLGQADVPDNAELTEGVPIPEDSFAITTTSITVTELGRSIPYTSLKDDLGRLDMKSQVQKKLRTQMEHVLDTKAATAFKLAAIKAVPTGPAALTFDADGTLDTTATSNLKVYHIEVLRDYMKDTLFVPPFEGGDFMCAASTKALRGIKDDARFEMWKVYTSPEAKFNSEVGRIENVRFVEINRTAALANNKGTGGVLGEALIFGEDAVAIATAVDPELRVKMPQDYGRDQGVAWYGILAFGIIWETANPGEAKIIHLTSA